jgi:heat-inducible transcriptional repressor
LPIKKNIEKELDARARQILESVIHRYIRTAEPVGSPYLARHHRLKISPASIRNTLNTLEQLGYLTQPHTSAGRMPTDQGYRFYVDDLMKSYRLAESIKERMRRQVQVERHDIEDILVQASHVLGLVSKQLGVTLTPRFQQGVFQRMELLPLSEKRVLVVLTIKSGLVRTVVMEIGASIPEEKLQETARLLNERLCDLSIQEIRETLPKRVRDVSYGDPKLLQYIVDSAGLFFDFPQGDHLYYGGTANIVAQPEFRDRIKLETLMDLLEEGRILGEVLSRRGGEGVSVTIGSENAPGEMRHYSLLTTRYRVGKVEGTIGIIGPTRMRYDRLSAVVDYMAKLLGDIWEQKG